MKTVLKFLAELIFAVIVVGSFLWVGLTTSPIYGG